MENNICYVCHDGECESDKFLPTNICCCSLSNRIHERCYSLLNNKYKCSICKNFYKNIEQLTTDDGLRIISEFDNLGFQHEYTLNSNDRKHGYHKIWYHNGNLWEENYYVDGAKQGIQKLYSFNGQLYRELQYNDGIRVN